MKSLVISMVSDTSKQARREFHNNKEYIYTEVTFRLLLLMKANKKELSKEIVFKSIVKHIYEGAVKDLTV